MNKSNKLKQLTQNYTIESDLYYRWLYFPCVKQNIIKITFNNKLLGNAMKKHHRYTEKHFTYCMPQIIDTTINIKKVGPTFCLYNNHPLSLLHNMFVSVILDILDRIAIL